MKCKEKAEYPDGRETDLTGAEAYGIYGQEVVGHLAKVGGAPMFSAAVERLMLGEVEELWDMTAIAMYPSRKAMREMISAPDADKRPISPVRKYPEGEKASRFCWSSL